MSSPSSNSFTKALDRFKDTLTDKQKEDFAASSLHDVESEISRIQASYGQRKELRNMNRLAKFLEAMQQVEELVTVFLNVHEAVAFVWGPIKFVLNIAKNKLESFEVLLDTYVEIGDAIPRLREYEQIFKDYPSVREVLERCFYDILEFHKAALDMFERTRWERCFDNTWKTFRTRFRPILDSIKRHRALLLDDKLTAAISEAQAGRGEARACHLAVEARFTELSKQMNEILEEAKDKEARSLQESLIMRRRFISAQLAPGNYEADQQSAFLQCSTSPSEDWVLQDERFKEWLQPRTNAGSVLYLYGMPGAGKTILVSRIINHLRSQMATLKGPVLFFYFKSVEEDKRSMSSMIRALLDQLIYQDNSLVDLLYPRCCSISDARLRTLSTLKELLEDCILTPQGCTIVLDGLDECQDEKENNFEGPKLIIDWINDSLIPELLNKGTNVRFLLSSQHVDFLEKELTRHPSIRLDQHVGHLCNIQAYTQSEASAIERRFRLSKPDTDALVQRVSAASHG
ncbi:hypothetical protein FDECE_11788 [Fusarium decemcellulare]|nr:hypothetical protein FDECE_11788 [Fusarium decemcellulare]